LTNKGPSLYGVDDTVQRTHKLVAFRKCWKVQEKPFHNKRRRDVVWKEPIKQRVERASDAVKPR